MLRPVPLVSVPFEVRSPTGRAPESGASPSPPRPTTARSGGTAADFGPAVLGHNASSSRPSRKMLYVGCHTYVTLSSLLMVLSHGSTDTLGGAIAPCFFALVHLPSASLEFLQTFPNGKIGSERARLPRQRSRAARGSAQGTTGVLELDEGEADGRVQEEPGSRSPRHGARWLGRGSEYQLEGTFVFLNFA